MAGSDVSPRQALKPARRAWLRFSLRGAFLLLTAVAVWFAWLAKTSADQRKSVSEITRRGGSVRYELDNSQFASLAREWLAGVVGVDYVARVSSVELRGAWDDDPEHFGEFVSEDDVRRPNGLGSFKKLFIFGRLTDEACARLADVRVEEAVLTYSWPSRSQIEMLCQWRSLRKLGIGPVRPADADLFHGMTHLRSLTLWETALEDDEVERLQRAMPNTSVTIEIWPSGG